MSVNTSETYKAYPIPRKCIYRQYVDHDIYTNLIVTIYAEDQYNYYYDYYTSDKGINILGFHKSYFLTWLNKPIQLTLNFN